MKCKTFPQAFENFTSNERMYSGFPAFNSSVLTPSTFSEKYLSVIFFALRLLVL